MLLISFQKYHLRRFYNNTKPVAIRVGKGESMKIVYIHIPRTAGNTIKNLFSSDVIVWSHNLRCRNYRFCSRGEYDFVFTFVRDPLTRFLSAYYYLRNGGKNEEDNLDGYLVGAKFMDIVQFAQERLENVAKWQIHFIPQTNWLQNLDHLDFVGRYENMKEDYKRVCSLLELPPKPLTYNPTDRSFLSKEIAIIKPIVECIYANDYKLIKTIDERKS